MNRPKGIAVSGASGLVGRELVERLRDEGYRVLRLTRSRKELGKNDMHWDPLHGGIDGRLFDGVEAVVHLAGENIAKRPWTERHKSRIRRSRVEGTRLIAETIARLPRKPRVLISASAVGYYGDRDDEVDEATAPGRGFLPDVCREWEEATDHAARAGIRVVKMRMGLVLTPRGGALGKMLPAFRIGIGGPVGGGLQPMSWISMDDALGAILFMLRSDSIQGPVNLTAPGAVTNKEFCKALGRVLRRPALMPVPGFMIRLIFGEMGKTLLLGGVRARPGALLKAGYRFQYPELEPALRRLLERPAAEAAAK